MQLPQDWIYGWAAGLAATASGFIVPNISGYVTSSSVFPGPAYPPHFFGPGPGEFNLPKAVGVGSSRLATPLGALECRRWRMSERWEPSPIPDGPVYIWTARGAGPFGIAKASLRWRAQPGVVSSELTLTRVLSGARSQIVGTPLPPNPDALWRWVEEGNTPLCLPQIGTANGGPPS